MTQLFQVLTESNNKPFELLLPIALILCLSKVLSILCRKIKLP